MATINSATIDYSALGKTVNDLRGGFRAIEFLDLCALIEAIVLHDEILVVTPKQVQMPDKWTAALKPWLDAGVLKVLDLDRTHAMHSGPRPSLRPTEKRSGAWILSQSTEVDAWHESSRILAAENALGVPALPLMRQRRYYESFAQPKAEHSVCDLIGRYERLKDALEDIRDCTRIPIVEYVTIPVPPLALIALQRARAFETVTQSTLEVRDQFAKLRRKLKELREFLSDAKIPPHRKLAIQQSWIASWQTLDDFSRESRILTIANSTNELLNADEFKKEIDDDFNPVDYRGLVSKLIKLTDRTVRRWRVRTLHRAAKNYLRTSDSEINTAVSRIFGLDERVFQNSANMLFAEAPQRHRAALK